MEDYLDSAFCRARRGDVRGVRGIMRLSCNGISRPWPAMWLALILAYSRQKNPRGTVDVLNEMRSSGIEPNSTHYLGVLKSLVVNNLVSDAHMFFNRRCETTKSVSSVEVTFMVKALKQHGKHNSVWELYNSVEKLKVTPSPKMCNTFLHAFAENGDLKSTEKLMRTMKDDLNMVPDVYGYTALIKACIKGRNTNDALRFFEEMIGNGVIPDVMTFNVLMTVLSKSNQVDKALELLQLVSERELNLTFSTYAPVLELLIKQFRFADAERIVEQMEERNIFLDEAMFKHFISGYCRQLRIQDAQRIMKKMIESGITPGLHTLTALLNGYCSANDYERCMKLFGEMREANLPLDSRCYNILMTSAIRAGKHQVAVEAYDEMVKRNLRPTTSSMNLLIRAHGFMHEIDRAVATYLEIEEPSVYSYSELLAAFFRNNKEAEALAFLERLRTSKVELNSAVYAVVMRNFARKGDAERTRKLFNEMVQDMNIRPDGYSYSHLFESYARAGNVKEALSVLEEMKAAGVKPLRDTFILLNKSLRGDDLSVCVGDS